MQERHDIQNDNEKILRKQEKQKYYYDKSVSSLSPLKTGDKVRVAPTKIGEKRWTEGKVIKVLGKREYLIETASG